MPRSGWWRNASPRPSGALAFYAKASRRRTMEGEYTGHVKDGKVHGVGVCVYTDGSRYQGDWKAGLKSGRGTHSFASGDQFEGEWENGWMHGLGVYTWKIGDKYIGEVHYGRIHGFGTYTWRTNSKYGYFCQNAHRCPALCHASIEVLVRKLLLTVVCATGRSLVTGMLGSGKTAGCMATALRPTRTAICSRVNGGKVSRSRKTARAKATAQWTG